MGGEGFIQRKQKIWIYLKTWAGHICSTESCHPRNAFIGGGKMAEE